MGSGDPARARPVLLTHALDAWPALERWADPSYLRRVAGLRTIPAERGASYLASDFGTELMPFHAFLDAIERRGPPASAGLDVPAASGTLYLAQHPLFDQIPRLRDDLLLPDYVALSTPPAGLEEAAPPALRAWLGPAGTTTPAHVDPRGNLLCQVVGRKYVRLWSASEETARGMYPGDGVRSNTSEVDVDRPDPLRFPLHARLPYSDVILAPGTALFIPAGWWHYVRSLELSFSVSVWWD